MSDALPARRADTLGARELLASHGGRATRTRIAVVEALSAGGQPLTHDEIGAALAAAGVAHDRVTLYRVLDWLVERGLARRVAGENRAGRFELASADGHCHAHFHCARCGQVICIEDMSPALSTPLPPGFQLDHAELVLHGACPACGEQRT
jgi:Fur family ferric uptake transcriptional regulator